MKIIVLFLLSFSLISCSSTYRAEGAAGALTKYTSARVIVHEEDSGDEQCKLAVTQELQKRGYKIVSKGSSNCLNVRMSDKWYWDMVMYLMEMNLTFTDSKTGELKAMAHYHNSALHGYPNTSKVVERSFVTLDAKGVFKK